ncbi:GNAT family N-acetyltransferase [Bacillus sp. ISL-47]|uniref:GNAT family N-acetyltransferase n=1 Tax=Bacillus sp. ISL-47 TaxID=2819130 RepID=UPI001BE98938|nr:GNAT family N-acetyltransferase [Bacillus sp. ISL-47]MBT2689430.1 GNAT family N-acetyltransferase [Bacillus sp. ISL-47]MBT2709847.1 GNAT family N-acetyltransferase [Pseudomonas sp. ISL-84]
MKVLETNRLILRWLITDDAEFILELLNEPAWIRYIGDKGVRTLEDAKNYILSGPMKMYSQLGFGLFLVERKEGSTPLGMCGLLKRESLEDVDIGFAFLSRYQAQGYGFESATATLKYGHEQLDLKRILAITSLDNHASSRLLEKIGMNYERTIILPNVSEELKLFASEI